MDSKQYFSVAFYFIVFWFLHSSLFFTKKKKIFAISPALHRRVHQQKFVQIDVCDQ